MNAPDDDIARLRVPPHSLEAEQSVLGALILESEAYGRITDVIVASDFYKHEHRIVFEAIERVHRDGHTVDVITVFEQLEGESTDFGGLAYLNALAESVPSAANIRRYAELIAERATQRALIAFSDEVATSGFNPQGLDVTQLIEQATAKLRQLVDVRKVRQRKLPLLRLDQLRDTALEVRWSIKHVMPANALGMIYGGSGTFKSFIALDAALHVVHGLPWMGRRTVKGPVVYIAAEGGSGLWPRVWAWHRARGLRWEDAEFYVLPVALDLRGEAWRVVEAVQALGITPVQIYVDTLSQTYSGEENSADEMAGYLREIGARFRELWSCTVVLIHHSGHTATDRPRGSSAIRANVDFLLGVYRDAKELMATLTCDKQKDGETFDDATFSLTVHTLGTDADGDKVTSLVARHLSRAEDVQEAMESEQAAGRGGKNQLFLRLAQNGIREDDLRKAFYDECGIAETDGRRQAYWRARKWAVTKGFVDIAQGVVITLRRGS